MSHDVIGADLAQSTSAPLAANATYTGAAVVIQGHASFSVELVTDQPSAVNGLQLQQSGDVSNPANWDVIDAFTIGPGQIDSLPGSPTLGLYKFDVSVVPRAAWGRVVYTNGGNAQGVFRLTLQRKATAPALPRALTSQGNLRVAIQEDATSAGGGSTSAASEDGLRRIEKLLGYLVKYQAEQNNDLAGIIEADEAISNTVGST